MVFLGIRKEIMAFLMMVWLLFMPWSYENE